jgi:hypothetical protein
MPMLMDAIGLPVVDAAADVIPFRGAKPKLLEGGFMPRGGSGRSAEIIPQSRVWGRAIERDLERTAPPKMTDSQAYDAAVARQKGRTQTIDLRGGEKLQPRPVDEIMKGPMSYQDRMAETPVVGSQRGDLKSFNADIARIRGALNDPRQQSKMAEVWAKLTPKQQQLLEQYLGSPPATQTPVSRFQGHPDQHILERAHGIRPDPMSVGAALPTPPAAPPAQPPVPLGPATVVRIPGYEGPIPRGRNPGQWIRGGLQGDGKPVYPKLVE